MGNLKVWFCLFFISVLALSTGLGVNHLLAKTLVLDYSTYLGGSGGTRWSRP